tara:strand:- start:650 stop:955 length:306 start_codon:yes stop_codon:yes gene_type:complete
MNFKEIQKRAYYIHLKFPNNSEETNWHIATKQLEELHVNKYNNGEYIVDFMKPNFYTTKTLDINHYSDYKMNQFKTKVYTWGMTEFYDIMRKLVVEFEFEQ